MWMKGGNEMNHKDENETDGLSEIEKWLETFFLDPLTSYMDQTTFRIDLYETDDQIIIEALLLDFHSPDVIVHLHRDCVVICVAQANIEKLVKREINLPFSVIDKNVYGHLHNNILEIFISKNEPGLGKNRRMLFYEEK